MSTVLPQLPFPIPQVSWSTQPDNVTPNRLIAVLNRLFPKWVQTIEACRRAVSGPIWNITVPSVTASRYLTIQDSTVLVDTTSAAVTLTLPLSTSLGFAGKVWTVKWVKGTNACKIAVTSPDEIDLSGGPFTVTPVLTAVQFQCDGTTGYYFTSAG